MESGKKERKKKGRKEGRKEGKKMGGGSLFKTASTRRSVSVNMCFRGRGRLGPTEGRCVDETRIKTVVCVWKRAKGKEKKRRIQLQGHADGDAEGLRGWCAMLHSLGNDYDAL